MTRTTGALMPVRAMFRGFKACSGCGAQLYVGLEITPGPWSQANPSAVFAWEFEDGMRVEEPGPVELREGLATGLSSLPPACPRHRSRA